MVKNPRTVAIAAALALVLSACGGKDQPQGGEMPPPDVGVVKVQPGDVPLQKDLVGRLAAFRSADVRARVPGVLQRRVYEEGSDVKAGQVLFLIDPAPLQAEVGQAQASLASAQANYANAKAAADRARRLAPEKFVSQSDLDNAMAAERSSGAAVKQAEAALANARINLGYATVTAPISGRANQQQVTEGALVGQGTPTLLTTVDQIDQLYVNFSLSVTELEQVRRAQTTQGDSKVTVVLPDGTPYERQGKLDFSGDVVDPSTGAIALRALIPNPDKTLLPGTFVTLKTVLGVTPNAYLVPQAGVQRDAKSAFVLVLGSDGNVARKDVVADRQQGGNWVVTKGLAPNDQVIVSGVQRAQPGKPAKVSPADAAGKTAGDASKAPAAKAAGEEPAKKD
ncbi:MULTISPECIES: efflux RND transporter periplasmic adaptor subunit [unclassified Lysobacter]|uniref:efflux RND transporter periplasmic adaptor subunit n=1 Tax=unclassified Lysobacter TaxID=2635362 RepID=UPI001C22E3F3|nr:efflux RND transporter periplasmic adaptor subunit [Lysobacter sp. MMG2]MBU8977623.1 efflux RND transporter periplasmic adaptor subunit [Lysobacter sp. MMG2]